MLFDFRLPLAAILLATALAATSASAQLVAYLPFNGDASDASGHGLNGSVVNALYTPNGYTGTGATGGAYLFDGSTAYIELSALDINPSVYPQLTMGAWVLASDINPIRQIISHDDGGLDRSLGLDARSGTNGWSAFAGSGWIAGEAATANQWTFVAVAYNQTAGTATLYVNDHAFSYTNAYVGSGWSFTRIGMNPSFGEYFAGTIDEVFFFSSALDATQMANLRLNGIAAVPEPATWALLSCGVGFVALRWRRRPA